ncbi:chemotaxis protein CheW [Natrarchaeobaculum aegyptiacum]|uniref:CheW-like domain-containing protein n=1 Tax=Natrarchaeobaculum aegyptiacum TaxID=745377 RepID=A0A2Z2HQ76_9EURY|nr:chemotaxis protein CheW [Natrarchaeobaculum aegyptiacum]ARS88773.1 hypothetical protein B1756_02700 [Natrarchaeobaculum aegyptiacum]
MTDDRARRIRNLRKRTGGRGDDDAASGDDDGTDGPDAGDEETAESPGDEPVKTDGNGEDVAGDESDDGGDGTDDESSRPEDTDDSSTSVPEDDVELEYSSDAAADADSGGDSDGSVATEHDVDHADGAEGSEASAGTGSAGTTVAAAAETAAVASPGASTSVGDGLKPMVETADASDSPFGGAIASEDVLSDFVDDVGTGETDAIGGGASGQSASVFDRDDSLVATTHEDDTIQMLEFYLNDDRYAIEIERISAIVEMKRITRFPRGPEAIDGVTDLRGEITAVLDPTAMLDVDRSELSDDHYIVVLERDDDKQKLGIRVTDVLQAVTYRESQIDETASVMDAAGDHAHEFVNGIVKKTTDGRTELVTWLDVDSIIENTE